MKRIFNTVKDYIKYDIPYGIKNLIIWFPVVWKDRNWDHYFIFVALRHKLHLTEQLIRNHGCHVHAEKDANQIKKCILLLDRLIADDYHLMAFKKVDEKWGDIEISSSPCEDRPGLYSVDITRPNVKTPDDEKQEKKDFKNAYEHEEYLRKQDKQMLFQLMNKYIDGWWD